MSSDTSLYQILDRSMPVAPLAIIALPSAIEMGQKVSGYISSFRRSVDEGGGTVPYHDNYYKENYLLKVCLERTPTGEGRGVLLESARGKDVFVKARCDVCHSPTAKGPGAEQFTGWMDNTDLVPKIRQALVESR